MGAQVTALEIKAVRTGSQGRRRVCDKILSLSVSWLPTFFLSWKRTGALVNMVGRAGYASVRPP
jgi:hypothetical protein